MNLRGAIILFGILCGLGTVSSAQAQGRLFDSQTEIIFTLEGPLTSIVRRAADSTEPQAATLILDERRIPLEISARGLSRRTRGICTFPPIRLDFARGAASGTEFRGQNRLKLVTRCRSSEAYQQLIVLEYLAYRLYNEVTDMSFRVRPARVTYRDTEGNRRDDTQFNFVIEDVDDLARRHRHVELEVQGREVRPEQLDPEAAAAAALFQFMIGNLDWDMLNAAPGLECCHNFRLLAVGASARERVIPAPYDFDQSGFVSAPYAVPPESIGVAHVRVRRYRGWCAFNDAVPAAIQRFQDRREALTALIAGETRLTEPRRREALRYIEGFYEVIGDPGRVERQILERCRS